MALFDVVIPTYDNLPELRECLASLSRQTMSDLRALICVDGSTDGTLTSLEEEPPQIPHKVLGHPGGAHRGRAATRNLALPELRSRYVLFLDSDMDLEPTCLAEHLAVLERGPCVSIGAVDYRQPADNLWTRYLSVRRLNRFRDGARLPYNHFSTPNAALWTDDFRASGGFDEHLVEYGGEDAELGFRITTTLARPLIANQRARAVSSETKTLGAALAEMETFGRTNLRYMHALHPGMAHVFGTDRLHSRRIVDRLFRGVMNPLTDRVVDLLLPIVPFVAQEQLINYKVVRAVCRGYSDAERVSMG